MNGLKRWTIFASVIVVGGCSSIAATFSERAINSEIREDGSYIEVKISEDDQFRRVTEMRFYKNDEKLTYSSTTFTKDGKVYKSLEFESGYFVRCRREKCNIYFSDYSDSVVYDYRVRVDKNGEISTYFAGKIYPFEFRPD